VRTPEVGGDQAPFLVRIQGGGFAYNYEYAARRGNDVLFFVLNVERPDRALAEDLVRRAVARYAARSTT
jgi:hypothetical protein